MIKKKHFTKLLKYLSHPKKTKLLLCLMNEGYLFRRGWINSLLYNKVIGSTNEPIPWFSYPAIDFLKNYLPKNATIFEYGSGYSTLFFSTNYYHVTSVENDSSWYNKISSLTEAENCIIHFKNQKEEYINTIEHSNDLFDLIVVDGSWRNECLEKAIRQLKSTGMLILDDADRIEYNNSIELLKKNNFILIPFIGMSALSYEDHHTLICFKKGI
jgi:hypothetical protein